MSLQTIADTLSQRGFFTSIPENNILRVEKNDGEVRRGIEIDFNGISEELRDGEFWSNHVEKITWHEKDAIPCIEALK